MIAIDQVTDEQFEKHALDVLQREIGSRWLGNVPALERSGTVDYPGDREPWQKDLTFDQVLESIRKHRLREPRETGVLFCPARG